MGQYSCKWCRMFCIISYFQMLEIMYQEKQTETWIHRKLTTENGDRLHDSWVPVQCLSDNTVGDWCYTNVQDWWSSELGNLFWKRASSHLSPTVSNMLCVFLTMLALTRPLPWKQVVKFLVRIKKQDQGLRWLSVEIAQEQVLIPKIHVALL